MRFMLKLLMIHNLILGCVVFFYAFFRVSDKENFFGSSSAGNFCFLKAIVFV